MEEGIKVRKKNFFHFWRSRDAINQEKDTMISSYKNYYQWSLR